MKPTTKIKILLAAAIVLFYTNTSSAQQKQSPEYDQGFRLGFGLNAGYATNNPYKLTLGADARLQYDLSKRYSLTLTTGFSNLFVSQSDGVDLGFIPAKAGFKAAKPAREVSRRTPSSIAIVNSFSTRLSF